MAVSVRNIDFVAIIDCCQRLIGCAAGTPEDVADALDALDEALTTTLERIDRREERILHSAIVQSVTHALSCIAIQTSDDLVALVFNLVQDVRISSIRTILQRLQTGLLRIAGYQLDSSVDPRVRDAVQRIAADHVVPSLHLSDVAKLLHLSSSHCSHLLRQHTGRSFTQLLHTARTEHAKRLLTTTRLSIKEIAARVGYANTTQLDHHFKRRAAMSPHEYRETLTQVGAARPQATADHIAIGRERTDRRGAFESNVDRRQKRERGLDRKCEP